MPMVHVYTNIISERLLHWVALVKKDYLTFPTEVQDEMGYADADKRRTKTRLALAVNELLKARKLKQREVAALLNVPQPKVSALKNYRLDHFSVEHLMKCLTALNQDVEIMIRPPPDIGEVGHISVFAVQ